MMATREELRDLGPPARLARLHADGRVRAVVIERAEGCVLVDIDGREYLDGVSSLWCNIHGHRHPRIDAAIREQLDRVAHVTSLGVLEPDDDPAGQAAGGPGAGGAGARVLLRRRGHGRRGGLKMAFQYWRQRPRPAAGKDRYLALGDAYHGDTLGSVSVGGVERFHAMFRPLLFETLRAARPRLATALPPGVTPARPPARTTWANSKRMLAEHHAADRRDGHRAAGAGRGRA